MLDLGKAVKAEMERKKLKPADLAKILGCSKMMVYHYMRGQKITIKRLVELAQIFGMMPSRLVALGENNLCGACWIETGSPVCKCKEQKQ